MINVIRADLVKLKKSFWFKFLIFLWVLSFTLIYILSYYQAVKNTWEARGFFHNILWNDKDFTMINSFLYIFMIFWFSLLADSLYWVDKAKDLILFTKNIRIKYFISKIIIILFFSFLTLLFISLFSSLSQFLTLKIFNTDLFYILFTESFTKLFLLYISIIPLLILFIFLNLIWVRALFIWIWIIFLFFASWMFKERIENSIAWKYYNNLNNYSLLWNYNNILASIINNQNSYAKTNIDDEYLDEESIKRFENTEKENKEINKKIKPLFELLNDWWVQERKLNSNWEEDFLLKYARENPEIQEKIDKLNKILDWDLLIYTDIFLYDRYISVYEGLWWEMKYFELNDNNNLAYHQEQKILNSRYYLSLSQNFLSILKDFFNINNRDFNVWFFHIIFLLLIWSIIMKRRQVYN